MHQVGAHADGLQHRLLVLALVLDDHPVDRAIGEMRVVAPQVQPVQGRQHLAAHLGEVAQRLPARQQGQGAAHRAGLVERVVQLVE